jgi:hypothetical protein
MIIGIFGDSYASEQYGPIAWSNLLRTQYHYNIYNYACAATCLFWSYQQLIKNIDNLDTVIFVATQYGRLYWPDADFTSDSLHMISSLWTIQHVMKHNPLMDPTRLAILKAAQQYHLHLRNDQFDMFVHNQIIKEISK